MPRSSLCLAISALALLSGGVSVAAKDAKPKKARLNLRATPRVALAPASVLVVAEIAGGVDDDESLYCPEIEWDWDDGGRSVAESDCPPFEAGTKLERRFSSRHEFRRPGVYNVRVQLSRGDRPVLSATINVTVRPGLGSLPRDED
jgi:hypothetical protein